MKYPIDPWAPGPTRPDVQETPAHEADQPVPEVQTSTQPKEPAPGAAQTKESQPAEAAAPSKSLALPRSRPEKPSAFSRAIGAARLVLPVVQKVLPLLEGNVATAAANLLAPSPRPIDLGPIKTAIGKMQTEQHTLRGQLTDQKRSLESIEYELNTIKEGLDRKSSELRELAEDQLKLRRRLTRLAWMIFILLFLSITLTALICVRLAYILRL